jgi:alkanesulfonate monooxygenase
MTEIHLIAPTRAPERPVLPSFVTDVRPAPYDGLSRAADLAGLTGLFVPFDPDGAESLVTAAGLLRNSRHLRVVAEFHPGIATPVYAAKFAASVQRFSHDRLGWQLAVDLDRSTARAQGDFLEGPDRYARAEEFLTIAKGVWNEADFTYEGRFYEVLGGGLGFPLSSGAFPRVHLTGTSPEALALSARHADVHIFDVGDDLETAIAQLPGVAYALRLPVTDALGETILEYADRGVTEFFLEAASPLEEAYRLGEHLLPLLRKEIQHVR